MKMELKRVWSYKVYIIIATFALLFSTVGLWAVDQRTSQNLQELQQLEQDERNEYQEYLSQVQENANSALLFFDADSYAAKNAVKTAKVYKPLAKISLVNDPSYGVNGFCKTTVTEYVLLMICLFLVFFYVIRDRENGMYGMLTVTKKGYKKLLWNRWKIVITKVSLWFILLYFCKAVYYSKVYGFYDLSRSIQSVYQMKDCVFQINVGQYLLAFLLFRWCSILLFTTMFYCICMWMEQPITIIISFTAFFIIEFFLFQKIENTSSLSYWKWLNLYTICFSDDLLRKYMNLSIFGYPMNALVLNFILIGFGMLFSMLWIRLGYKSLHVKTGFRKCFVGKRMQKQQKKSKHCPTLFFWEVYKIFIQQKVWVILVLFCVAMAFTYEPEKTYYGDLEEREYHDYMTKWEGTLTTEISKTIANQQKYYETLTDQLMRIDLENSIEQQRIYDGLKGQDAYNRVLTKVNHVKEKNNRYLVYDTGYEWLLGSRGRNLFLLFLAVVFLATAFSVAGISSYDKMQNTYELLTTTKNGFRRRKRTLWLLAFGTYTFYYLVVFGLRLIAVGSIYGYPALTANAGGLIISIINYDNLSILGVLLLYHLLYYLLGAGLVTCCMMISRRSNSYMQATLLSLFSSLIIWALVWYVSSLIMI